MNIVINNNKLNKKAFTLVEILVGIVILSIVFAGLLAAFTAARKYVLRANRRLVTANLSRSVLERLYKEVREDYWSGGTYPVPGQYPLRIATGLTFDGLTPAINSAIIADIEGENYTGNYDVGAVAGQDYREVAVTVTATAW